MRIRGLIVSLMLVMLLLVHSAAVLAEPDYAKWGRLAMEEAAKRFKTDIVDYKYEGKKQRNGGVISQHFRLLLRDGKREFGVAVTIWFYRDTEKVIRIQMDEIEDP